MDLNTLIQVIPLALYLCPSLAIDRLALRSQIKLSRWVIYVVPALAWIASVFARDRMDAFMGMGNWLFEPLVLSIAPIAFFALAGSAHRFMRDDTTRPEVGLIVTIALAVFSAGVVMPAIGDWP